MSLFPFRRPGEIDVTVHAWRNKCCRTFSRIFRVARIGVDGPRVRGVGFLLRDVLQGQRFRQDIHRLWKALAFQPVRAMLAHRVSEDGRGQADACLVGPALLDFGDRGGFAIDATEELVIARLVLRLGRISGKVLLRSFHGPGWLDGWFSRARLPKLLLRRGASR